MLGVFGLVFFELGLILLYLSHLEKDIQEVLLLELLQRTSLKALRTNVLVGFKAGWTQPAATFASSHYHLWVCSTIDLFSPHSFGWRLVGDLCSFVFHESYCCMHLIVAVSTKRHVTIVTLNLCLGLTSITFSLSTLPIAFDDGIYLRTLDGALFARLHGAATLTGEFFLESVLTGRTDEGLAAASE